MWFTKGMACPFCRSQMSQLSRVHDDLQKLDTADLAEWEEHLRQEVEADATIGDTDCFADIGANPELLIEHRRCFS